MISFKEHFNTKVEPIEERGELALAALLGLSSLSPSMGHQHKHQTPQPKTHTMTYDSSITPELRNMIIKHEGIHHKAYKDSRGILTIGVGFNLTRPDAKEQLKKIGADYNNVIRGAELSEKQIQALFDFSLKEAINNTREVVSSFDTQPTVIKNVLVDMSFNLGKVGLSKFRKFIAAINSRDYNRAYKEMINSSWYRQVGNRSKELVSMVKQSSGKNLLAIR